MSDIESLNDTAKRLHTRIQKIRLNLSKIIHESEYVKSDDLDSKTVCKNEDIQNLPERFLDVRVTAFEHESNSPLFTYRESGQILTICLNEGHPAYEHYSFLLDFDADKALDKGSYATLLLLVSWATYESELPTPKRKERAQESRYDWGRVIRWVLKPNPEENDS